MEICVFVYFIDRTGGRAAVLMDGQGRCGRDFPAFVMEPGGQAYWPRRRRSRRGDGRTRKMRQGFSGICHGTGRTGVLAAQAAEPPW